MWSGQPAAREEAQSEERAGDPGDAGSGEGVGRTTGKDAPSRGLESLHAPSSQVRRARRLLCLHLRRWGDLGFSSCSTRER